MRYINSRFTYLLYLQNSYEMNVSAALQSLNLPPGDTDRLVMDTYIIVAYIQSSMDRSWNARSIDGAIHARALRQPIDDQ